MNEATGGAARGEGRVRWVLLAGIWLIYFCFGMSVASLAPLVTPISRDLGISNTVMGAILGAWPLAYIAAALPVGILLDRIGVRAGLLLAALFMALSLAARGLSQEPWQLLLAVGIFGLGGPMISIGAPKAIARLFPGVSRGTAMGIYMTGPSFGAIYALSLTNSVLLPLGGGEWRFVFAAHTAVVLLSAAIWLGLSALPAARASGWDDEPGKRFDIPAFLDILRSTEVRLILLLAIGIFFFNHGLNNWLPEILRERGFGPAEAGLLAALPTAVGILGALVIPRYATPPRRIAVMAGLLAAAIAASLLLQAAAPGLLLPGLVLQGIARSSLMTVAILLLMDSRGVPQDRLGLAGGLFFTFAEVGGVLGPLTFGVVSDLSGGFAVPLATLTLVCAGLLAMLARLARA
jgi:cyanate permease